jgi:hypothetical protein
LGLREDPFGGDVTPPDVSEDWLLPRCTRCALLDPFVFEALLGVRIEDFTGNLIFGSRCRAELKELARLGTLSSAIDIGAAMAHDQKAKKQRVAVSFMAGSF